MLVYSDNNYIHLVGKCVTEPCDFTTYSTYTNSKFRISVRRVSGEVDELEVVCPKLTEPLLNKTVSIKGQIRTRLNESKRIEDNACITYVYATELDVLNDFNEDKDYHLNDVILRGKISRFIFRETVLSKTRIGQVLLSVDNNSTMHHKVWNIPLILWHDNAQYINDYIIKYGKDNVSLQIFGRLQQREFERKIKGITYNKETHEVSACTVKVLP